MIMRIGLAFAFGMVLFLAASAWAATETVLWSFNPLQGDAGFPSANALISDGSGNFYGSTTAGGTNGTGAFFKLSPNGNGGWNESVLHSFGPLGGTADGYYPFGHIARDKHGNLFGTTEAGGTNSTGTVYEMSSTSGGGWTETVIHNFGAYGSGDGSAPLSGLSVNAVGKLYGTTGTGGGSANCENGCGTVYQLSPTSGGGWTETILHSFNGNPDGSDPISGVMLDKTGNLYGTTITGGGYGYGTVYRVKNTKKGWIPKVLYAFRGGKGENPSFGDLVMDRVGNLYGTAYAGGLHNTGAVWELVYSATKNTYSEKVLYNFGLKGSSDGTTPEAGVTLGRNGNLYGTTIWGGTYTYGTVFELVQSKHGHWQERIVHDFTGSADGGFPSSDLIKDAAGNLYGLAGGGGTYLAGAVFQFTQ
jgi:uncharacterized repeat protein (TIGR03803 family)